MSDIRTISRPEAVTADWLLADGILAAGHDLETAVVLSLLTDATARPDDVLPGFDDEDRRGWWGDHEAGDIWNAPPIGSLLWLLSRAKQTEEVRSRAESHVRNALAWLTGLAIASRVDVSSQWIGEGVLSLEVIIWRGSERLVALRFQSLWDLYKV